MKFVRWIVILAMAFFFGCATHPHVSSIRINPLLKRKAIVRKTVARPKPVAKTAKVKLSPPKNLKTLGVGISSYETFPAAFPLPGTQLTFLIKAKQPFNMVFEVLSDGTFEGRPVHRMERIGLPGQKILLLFDKRTKNMRAVLVKAEGDKDFHIFAKIDPYKEVFSWPLRIGMSYSTTYIIYKKGKTVGKVVGTGNVQEVQYLTIMGKKLRCVKIVVKDKDTMTYWYSPKYRFWVRQKTKGDKVPEIILVGYKDPPPPQEH